MLRNDLPATLDPVLRKGLARDPQDRYASCNELLRSSWVTLGDPVSPAGAGLERAPGATQLSADATASADAPIQEPTVPPAPPAPPASSAEGARGEQDTRAGPGRGRRRVALALGAALVLAGAVIAAVLLASGSSGGGKTSSAALAAVPTNHATGVGNATVSLSGNRAVVAVNTEGLDRGAPLVHLMHIHAGAKGECPPPSAARLHNGHLAISTTNGAVYYGPPVQSLTTHGDTSAASILAFPRYLSGGTLHYQRTITLPAAVASDIRNNNAVIIVHGVDYDSTGIYSGVLGLSELNKGVPGTATAPALCGKLIGLSAAAAARTHGKHGALLYSAALKPSALSLSEALLCIAYLRDAITAADRRRGSAGALAGPGA
jgi:hypothetical protein